jgi:dTDP-glucose 4,6-dehydratase
VQNLLITGGCGFIGTNFIRYLLSESDTGASASFDGRIINVDKLTYAGNPENLAGHEEKFPGRYHFIQADICDHRGLTEIFKRFKIDAVCHFAAESHVDRSIVAPDAFVQTNIVGTFNLLELVRENQDEIQLFHHISTDEVFGSLGEQGYFTEQTAYDPSSPYSASKAGSDHLVRAYSRTYGLPVTISNCSNNYGPYQFPEKLIPLMILNSLEGKSLPVYGDGMNVRDWLYVTDHCRAIWLIMQDGRRGETYNIGGRCEMPNIEVVEMICDILDRKTPDKNIGPRRELITFVKDRPGHDRRYAIDCAKLQNELGWSPDESFATGLEKTIGWYLENRDWVARVRSGEYKKWVHQQYGDAGE